MSFLCLMQPMKQGQNAKTCDQRLIFRSFKGVHPTAMHVCIPKVEFKANGSIGKTGDKTISKNFADLTVYTTHENSDT